MTEIKNSLFRFATMRAPELVSEDAKEKFFVQHPDPVTLGHFRDLVETPVEDPAARQVAFNELAEGFTSLESVEELKTLVGPLFFEFANWLAKNATAVSKDPELFASQVAFSSVTALDSGDVLTLWDNLFYQVMTRKPGPLRDQVMQALVANHFLSAGESIQHLTALSHVVMPPQLFSRGQFAESIYGGDPKMFKQDLQKNLDVVLARDKVTRYTATLEEVKNVQQQYERTTRDSYKIAKEGYDAELVSFLTDNTVVDEETGEAKVTPVPFTPFEFVPVEESLDSLLSAESNFVIDQELGINISSAYAGDTIELLNKEIEKQNEVIFNETRFHEKIVSLNNVLFPVAASLPDRQQYNYLVYGAPIKTGHQKIFIVLNMGFPATVAHVDYSATYMTEEEGPTLNELGTAFVQHLSTPDMLVLELFPKGTAVLDFFNADNRFEAQIYLSNGGSISLNTQLPYYASQFRIGVSGLVRDEFNINIETPTIPGYGVKRLGIADYRQVEQNTCCYVPGEVSHIENVMAREYKEKSSRRLRRSEDTLTVERQTEKEDLNDTTTTDRYEMQQQTSAVINKDLSSSVNTNTNISAGPFVGTTIGSNFAYNTSQQESNSQAVTYAQDVTQRAQERVVQKVREERVLKIIDEFEEQNKHGFDNRKGNVHVSGVYRWVDKIYKNRVFNYGKRLVYEFMVPQPAKFHTEAMKLIANSPLATVLEKPIDPRTRDLKDYRDLTEFNAAAWAAAYNAEIEPIPDASIRVSKAFQMDSVTGEIGSKADKVELPEGYKAMSADVNYMFYYHPTKIEFSHIVITVGDQKTPFVANNTYFNYNYRLYFTAPINKEVAVGIEAADMSAVSCTVVLNCVRTDQFYKEWQLNSFNAIIEAYEKKLVAYNDALAAQLSNSASKPTNPAFYRQIENTVLRKNCIQMMIPSLFIGKKLYAGNGPTDLRPALTPELDNYASIVKFIEQAFEWDIMSYTFYPFYWAEREAWQSMYQAEVDDSLFRSFLQSGMARVIVTARPGFEDAVMHFMACGQLWNGGQVPVIGDDLYLSIIEELKNPTYYVEESWETRVPTTLTVIQAGSIGLDTEGLPCCEEEEETGINQKTNMLTGVEEETEG